ncbi:hypothetical protein SAMN04487765_0296 [Tenacibaculum sp. MAR_2010_89]|nr:hypothetical protein SAMN04487765_0296 [Tenacibaculum sp. MAR_2010_89]
MTKYIKYLISFLLIFGLTVNECSIYSQTNSSNPQALFLNTRKKFNYKRTKLYLYSAHILSRRILSFVHTTYCTLKYTFNIQVKLIFKLQTDIYQKTSSRSALHVFLRKIITSSNHYSNLYIA